ncbi:hypothetical protein HYH02_007336 [Chlamydomonas schloesseri]|uniref:Uncharacterized protein n=1 Tax=Chlamydomonas schloesseri TaxID=2026947 RepID=A0A835WI42_9CHLO|nr:hypothetical protein HYH02_007336 [Chlamydomonas schloesseri]|eukprot:KAG2447880.1 hypothetical protein HYH02_007336 [Chlamydomonas schloesseri]
MEQLDQHSRLTDLPVPVLQHIVAMSGTSAVACASHMLQAVFTSVVGCPGLCARFLLARHGAATALYHAYNAPELRMLLQPLSSSQASSAPAESHAAHDAFLSLIKELLKLGAHLKPQARFLLTAAASYGDTRVLEILLRNGADAASCGGRALVAAASAGFTEAMDLLLAAGVSARAENGAALRAACKHGQLAAARVLLRRGADPRAAAGAALVEAAGMGHLAVVLELLAAGADARADGSRALQEAAAGGYAPVVLALLVAGAQPGARNGLALRRAAAGNHTAVVQVLQAAASRDISVPGIAPSSAGDPQGRGAATSGTAATGTSPPRGAAGGAGSIAAPASGRSNSGGWSSVAAVAISASPAASGASAGRRGSNGCTAPSRPTAANMNDARARATVQGGGAYWLAGTVMGGCANGPGAACVPGTAGVTPPPRARHASQPHSPVCAVAGSDARSLFASVMMCGAHAAGGAAAAHMSIGGQSI